MKISHKNIINRPENEFIVIFRSVVGGSENSGEEEEEEGGGWIGGLRK